MPDSERGAPSLERLRGRIDRMEARLNARSLAGADPDPLAVALLEKARRDLAAAERPIQRIRLAHRLDVMEAKFLSP
jgi:hypothetical protein